MRFRNEFIFLSRLWLSRPRLFNNPVIKREVIDRLRKPSSFLYFATFLAIVFLYLLGQWYVHAEYVFYRANQVREQYLVLNLIRACVALVLVPMLSATGINLEYERESWELLQTTHINPASIVLAKLLSSILFIWLMILGLIPFYAIFMVMGTIEPMDILVMDSLLTEAILTSGLIGLCCSAYFSKPIQSITAAFAGTAAYAVGTLIVAVYYSNVITDKPLLFGLPMIFSPFYLVIAYFEGSAPSAYIAPWALSHQYLLHTLMNISFMILLFLFCLRLIRNRALVRTPTQKMTLIQSFGIRKFFRQNKRHFSDAELEIPDGGNPVYWKERKLNENSHRLGNYVYTGILFLFSAFLILNQFTDYNPFQEFHEQFQWDEIIYWPMFLIPLFVIPYAVNAVRSEKDRGTWEILCTTTLRTTQILWGKVAGGLRLFLWRFLAFYGVIFFAAVCLYFDFNDPIRFLFEFPFLRQNYFNLVSSCLLLGLIWGFFYVAGGIYFSTRSKQTNTAYLITILFFSAVLFFPIAFSIPFNFSSYSMRQDPFYIASNSVVSPVFLLDQYFAYLRYNDPRFPGLRWLKFVVYQAVWMSVAGFIFLYLARKRMETQD